jgi:hypothetical protein
MDKKQRYRVFWFTFNNNSEDNKEFLKTLVYEYIMFYQAEDTKIISGLIRFKNQRLQKSVETKTFLNKATIILEKRSEKKIKALYSQRYKIYEYGTPTNQGARNDIVRSSKPIKAKDQHISKINEEISKKDKENDEAIQSFQNYNNSKSEQLEYIKSACLNIANINSIITKNNNETRKDLSELICFIKGIQYEIQDLHYNTKFEHMNEVKKIFNNAYEKLNSELCPVSCTNITKGFDVPVENIYL